MYQYIWEHHKTIRLTSSQAIEAKERDKDGVFKREKSNSQEGGKSKCLVNRCLLCHADKPLRYKVTFGNNSLTGTGHLSNFL